MIDPRTALPFLLLILPSAVLCGVFSGLSEADHHDGWVMGVLGGLCIGLFVVIAFVMLVLLGDDVTARRPRFFAWVGLLLATLAGFMTSIDKLAGFPWLLRWTFALLCLLPLPLTLAAVRATRPRNAPNSSQPQAE